MNALGMAALSFNVAWFGMAFRFFAMTPSRAVRLLAVKEAQQERSYGALVSSLPFLGGMNLGWAVASAASLYAGWRASQAAFLWPLLLGATTAHASQFACNFPLALRGGRAGGAPWDVLRGPMALIFTLDAVGACLNLLALFASR